MQWILIMFFWSIKLTRNFSNEILQKNDENSDFCKTSDLTKSTLESAGSQNKPINNFYVKKNFSNGLFEIIIETEKTPDNFPLYTYPNLLDISEKNQDEQKLDQVQPEKNFIDIYINYLEEIKKQTSEKTTFKKLKRNYNMTINSKNIRILVKLILSSQNINLNSKHKNNLEAIIIEENLIDLKSYGSTNEITTFVESYQKLRFFFLHKTVILEYQILEIINKTNDMSVSVSKYSYSRENLKIYSSKLRTIVHRNIPFLKDKILNSTIAHELRILLSIYFDYFALIVTYMLTFQNNDYLRYSNCAYLLYKYIYSIFEVPIFLFETDTKKIFSNFLDKVRKTELENECFSFSKFDMFIEFKNNFKFVLQTAGKKGYNDLCCCAYILQKYPFKKI